eukprot:1330793-Amorphochlora_amoeboformis.AAC.1
MKRCPLLIGLLGTTISLTKASGFCNIARVDGKSLNYKVWLEKVSHEPVVLEYFLLLTICFSGPPILLICSFTYGALHRNTLNVPFILDPNGTNRELEGVRPLDKGRVLAFVRQPDHPTIHVNGNALYLGS